MLLDRCDPELMTPARVLWTVKGTRHRVYALDSEDLLRRHTGQDPATSRYGSRDRADYEGLFAAFRDGYTSIRSRPVGYANRLEAPISGRRIPLANDVAASQDTEERSIVPECFGRMEARLQTSLTS